MTKLTAHQIKQLRHVLGMSQFDFAELLNAGIASVRRWESGNTEPMPIFRDKINQLIKSYPVKILVKGKVHYENR